MTAEAATDCSVYQCVVCGPCLLMHFSDGEITVQRDIPHPEELTFDEEERPQ